MNAALREFYARAGNHPHGWGLARFGNGVAPSIAKEPASALESEYLKGILEKDIVERVFLAHIRFATVGTMDYANCHPFSGADSSGRIWTLVHNGTIFPGAVLNDYIGLQYGETDSERVLLHFIARMDRAQNRLGRPLSEEERFDVLSSAIAALAKGSKLNLLFYDGEILYAHTNFRNSLYLSDELDAIAGAGGTAPDSDGPDAGKGIVFATSPLSRGNWKPVPFMRLVAVRDGEIVREGPSHGNEYIYNPEDYRDLYLNFAGL